MNPMSPNPAVERTGPRRHAGCFLRQLPATMQPSRSAVAHLHPVRRLLASASIKLMNLLFRASDAAFERAALSGERFDTLLASQMRLRRAGTVVFFLLLLFPIPFFGALVLGDPFNSPVWQWLLSPESIQSRTNQIQLGGFFLIALLCSSIGIALGADYRIKLLLSIRALRQCASTRDQASGNA